MPKPWFVVKKYGVGLSPNGLRGWAVLAAFVVLLGLTAPVAVWLGAPLWVAMIVCAVLTVGLIALAVIKSDGEPWRWRWDDR